MKIISKFKDYYDYLQGIYGMDTKIVYERKCLMEDEKKSNFEPCSVNIAYCFPNEVKEYTVYICGTIYKSFILNGNIYLGLEGAKYLELYAKTLGVKVNMGIVKDYIYKHEGYGKFFGKQPEIHLIETDMNNKYNCPVMMKEGNTLYKNVKLVDYGINKILSSKEIFIKISDFLSPKEISVDKRTNIQKIESHGFDKKTSFRNIK